jgi:hypothetical protein
MAKLVLVRHSSQIGRIYMNKGIRDTTDDPGISGSTMARERS